MWKKNLENLTLTGHIENKRSRGHLPNEIIWMDDRMGSGRDDEKTNITKSYKE